VVPTLPEADDGSRRIPAVIYAAKSTEDKHESIPEQLADGREMAAENGWIVVGEFSDAGFSAYSGNRGPDLEKATTAARAAAVGYGTPCMLIAQAHDRFARGAGDAPGAPQHLVELWIAMRREDVHLRTVEDDFDMRDVGSVAAIGQRAMMDSRRKSKAVKKGIGRAAKRGKPWGRQAAFGYRRGEDGLWSADPVERPIYERIFRERVEYARSYSGMAKLFNSEGVPTRTPGAHWTSTTIKNILSRRYGLGEFRHNDEWIKGSHEPLIDEAVWDAAQALAALGDRFAPARGGRRPHLHLFTNGILRCGYCFEAMLPRSEGDLYTCRTNKQIKGAGGCPQPDYPREYVDRRGLALFERVFLDLDSTREHVNEGLRARAAEIDALHARAVAAEFMAADRLTRVRRDYTNGDITAAEWRELRGDLESEHAAAVAERDRLAANAEAVRESRAELDAEAGVLRRLGALRGAVVERKRTAEQKSDVDALRSALAQTFNCLELTPSGAFTFDPKARMHGDRDGWRGTVSVPLAARTSQHLILVS
jgi:DNA invertase Pin-like site-specific DNA recombinase